MSSLIDTYDMYTAPAFLVPGLIILYCRSRFVTGRRVLHAMSLLDYLAISLIYYALMLPAIDYIASTKLSAFWLSVAWILLIFLIPAFAGLLLGALTQRDILYKFLHWCGLSPVHEIPSAWDWKFGNMDYQWVLVTLRNGTRFGGFCGPDSFVSSDPGERDIYVQWIYDIDENNTWSSRGNTGVLITSGEISTIEFWPYTPTDTIDEEK